MKERLAKLGVIALFSFTAFSAQADKDIKLGQTLLFQKGQLEANIPLLLCRRVNAIKIQTEKNIYLKKAIVTFKNEKTKVIAFNRKLKANTETNWRPFAYKRYVKNITVFGNSEPLKAGITVFGKRK